MSPPPTEKGMPARASRLSRSELNSPYSSTMISPSVIGMTIKSRALAACKLSNSPDQRIWSGEFDNLQAARARLLIVIPITLGLIMVLLYGLFNSLRDSLLALAGIPFSVGGGLIALYLSGLNFSVSAAIGFISLF